MSKKKSSVDFLAGFRNIEERDAIRRRPPASPITPEAPANPPKEAHSSRESPQQLSRIGKVAITQWTDPAVRKQLARLALDQDTHQGELLAEALNLLFEKYGQPPIAT